MRKIPQCCRIFPSALIEMGGISPFAPHSSWRLNCSGSERGIACEPELSRFLSS
jgi:hypothetical protein